MVGYCEDAKKQLNKMKTIYSLVWLTEKCKSWILKHCQLEDYQIREDGIVIEHRYIIDILHGLKEDGFTTRKDFLLI